jgi:hypothetical protein
MLIIPERTEAYFRRVVEFACAKGLAEALFERLHYLHTYADHELTGRVETELLPDFAPASFGFTMWWRTKTGDREYLQNGGLVYHGDQSGWRLRDRTPLTAPQPTFAVLLCPSENPWSIHT